MTSPLELPTPVCGVADSVGAAGTICRWDIDVVRWHISGSAGRLSADDVVAAYGQAWDAWANVCGFRHEYTSNPRTAHMLATFGRIDGTSGTLAWSELPCGSSGRGHRQLAQKYDGENWVVADNPPSGTIDLRRVMTHENGHGIGIPHIAQGNLMQPMYDTRIDGPQQGDITEALARYGRPDNVPSVPDSPTVPAPGNWRELAAIGYRGEKLVARILGAEIELG